MNPSSNCSVSVSLAASAVLLDIEGTTSSISFVHDVMFPYVREHLAYFLKQHFQRADVQTACDRVAIDAGQGSLSAWATTTGKQPMELVIAEVHRLMDGDVKATGLKALQGLVWELGFADRSLRSHVYPDVITSIRRWREAGCDVRIYSSGSIAAQKLFFGHVDLHGDCLDLFTGHYDTTIGSKKEPSSYRAIALDWGVAPQQIIFISDLAAELTAAHEAQLQAVASVRPGNAVLPSDFSLPTIASFDQLHVSPLAT